MEILMEILRGNTICITLLLSITIEWKKHLILGPVSLSTRNHFLL